MRISSIKLENFRRFCKLEIKDVPASARLVVMAGPNGVGKSSIFDALLIRYRMDANFGYNNDIKYFLRPDSENVKLYESVSVSAHGNRKLSRGALYVRSAHRHDPQFSLNSIERGGSVLDQAPLNKLIDADASVAKNYGRLAAQAMEDIFLHESPSTTMEAYRDKLIGEIRDSMKRLFPDLVFAGIGNPFESGTFKFNKGRAKGFEYQNLSGGEKAAFDLILDIVVKRKSFTHAVYCIDEPETHVNTKIQGALLDELLRLIPEDSQLWIASHSVGMMRKARELYELEPSSVVFLDFNDRNFDEPTIIAPQTPNRNFWEGVLNVALHDIASLVSPREVILCEGNPFGSAVGKNVEYDARIYSSIFGNEILDCAFISAGSAGQVSGDFIGLAAALPKISSGIKVRRLIDLDDHSRDDVEELRRRGITVLGRRHIEAYLFDDEVLAELCMRNGQGDKILLVLKAKSDAIDKSVARGNPADDVKSAAGEIYVEIKKILGLTQVGNDKFSFAKNTLATLITPKLRIYHELKEHIFMS